MFHFLCSNLWFSYGSYWNSATLKCWWSFKTTSYERRLLWNAVLMYRMLRMLSFAVSLTLNCNLCWSTVSSMFLWHNVSVRRCFKSIALPVASFRQNLEDRPDRRPFLSIHTCRQSGSLFLKSSFSLSLGVGWPPDPPPIDATVHCGETYVLCIYFSASVSNCCTVINRV